MSTETLDLRKARGLMIVIETIIAQHHRGEVVLNDQIFRLFEIAKSIKWANNDTEFVDAMRRLSV